MKDMLLAVVDHAIRNHPRTLQTAIGPSEIGQECDQCLGRRLLGQKAPEAPMSGWKPTVGTAVHAWLASAFTADNNAADDGTTPEPGDWVVEERLTVGTVGGETITGSSDLFHLPSGTVVDHKLLGSKSLTALKKGLEQKSQYQAQLHLYGLGHRNAGRTVRTVGLFCLPRDGELSRAVWVEEPFDPELAKEALRRADRIAWALHQFGADDVIPRLPTSSACWDCARYDTSKPRPGQQPPATDLAGLLGLGDG